MKSPERPLTESYWVEPGRFLAGEYPAGSSASDTRQRLDALLKAGFDTFIDLTRPDELDSYREMLEAQAAQRHLPVICQRFPIGDFGLPTHPQMAEILDVIDAALAGGHKVYLHCWGGIGRTGTTVGCYLVRRGKSGVEALQQLATWWREVPKSARYPHSPETVAQRAFILDWHE
jgi:hypothetical protein